jgi:hypothetical protein
VVAAAVVRSGIAVIAVAATTKAVVIAGNTWHT